MSPDIPRLDQPGADRSLVPCSSGTLGRSCIGADSSLSWAPPL